MQNLQRLAVERVGFGVLRKLVFDARYNGILVVIQPGGGVSAGGGVDEFVATVGDDLSALHALGDAELDQMLAPAHTVSRDFFEKGVTGGVCVRLKTSEEHTDVKADAGRGAWQWLTRLS